MGGRRGSILVRTPKAKSRGVVSKGGTIWDKEERIGGWPAFVIQKVLKVGIGGWVCVRCKGQEGMLGPPFIERVVVLYGPPAEGLQTGVDLEDVRLVQVWRVKEGWVKMKRGGGT